MFEEARQVTIPLQVLLHWDDEGTTGNWPCSRCLGRQEKTLQANLGGHTGVPRFEGFFARHLK